MYAGTGRYPIYCGSKCQRLGVAMKRGFGYSVPIEWECQNCGVLVRGMSKAGIPRKYCSMKCQQAYHSTPWRSHGLTREQYDALVANGCEACGAKESRGGRPALVVDHDHGCCPGETSCGKCVRGALCSSCNAAEGMLLGDPNRATALAFYMAKFTNVLEASNA